MTWAQILGAAMLWLTINFIASAPAYGRKGFRYAMEIALTGNLFLAWIALALWLVMPA